jgi:hypothetical protein
MSNIIVYLKYLKFQRTMERERFDEDGPGAPGAPNLRADHTDELLALGGASA